MSLVCFLPLHLIFYVTGRCNLRCQHCFYWREINKNKRELSLVEIEKISRSLGRLLWLALTGGEPFLRPDLAKIARIFVRNNRVKHISIPTNGWLAESILEQTEQMLKQSPATTFSITVSCDGLEKTHDEIRGRKGSFQAAIKTIKALKKLKKNYQNLGVGITMTFNRLNQTEFNRAYEYFRDEIKPDDIVINLIRGEPRRPTTAEVDLELYRQAVEQKMSDVRRGRIRYYQFGAIGKLAAARDGLMYQQILNYKQGKAKYLPCLAGRLSAVINEEGRVYVCELLTKAVGDLRKYNYDFKKLWQSPKAAKLRDWIWQTKCSCTHECFLTTNIFFSPKVYPELLHELLRLYAKR